MRVNGERRDGTMADLEQLLKLTQMTDALDTPGRNILEPNDVALDVRHLLRALAAARLTDRVWSGEPSSEEAARDCIRMGEIIHGGREAIEARPVMFGNVNVNSPMHFDVRMLEGLLTYADAGQAIIVTPFLLMGRWRRCPPRRRWRSRRSRRWRASRWCSWLAAARPV